MEVRLRNVDEWVVASLRTRARTNNKTLENEIRDLLRKEALRPKMEMAAELRRMRNELRKKSGPRTDAADLVREDRDSRG